MTRPFLTFLVVSAMASSLAFAQSKHPARVTSQKPAALTVRMSTPEPRYPETAIFQPVFMEPGESTAAPAKVPLRIRRLDSDLPVPGASAKSGDYLLQNETISIVVSDPLHPTGNSVSGGYVTDAYLNERPSNQLGQLHLYLNDKYPRMARFLSARIVSDGRSDDAISLEVSGTDSDDSDIDVVTTYVLRRKSSVLEIATAIVPRTRPLHEYPIGDAFAWGQAQQFAPGPGYQIGSGRITVPWVGGTATSVAYGLYRSEGDIWGPVGSTWGDFNGTTATLRAGESTSYTRYLVVGRDLAEITKAALEGQGIALSVIKGTVREDEGNAPAEDVRVNVFRDGRPFTEAVTRDGHFTLALPDGDYVATTQDRVRGSLTPPVSFRLPEDKDKPMSFTVQSPAIVRFEVRDSASGQPVPFKATFLGNKNTPNPDLGPVHRKFSRNIANIIPGENRVVLPAGDYSIVLSRGIEYDISSHTLTLRRNRETAITETLRRAVDTRGYVSGDFHQHMKNSFDSAVPLEDRVISSACEGLQFIVATDHNFVTDLAPVIRRLGLSRWIASEIGDEVTPRKHLFGHFIGFPLQPDSKKSGNGAIGFENVTAAQIFSEIAAHPGDQVVQVNHPRSGDIGYFNRVDLSPEDGTTTHPNWSDRFTAIEVLNGKRVKDFEETSVDWFNLLNLGYTFTATGNSDSHKVFEQEPGYPRNYVAVSAGTPSRIETPVLVKAINEKHTAFVTNGPIVKIMSRHGSGIGAMETCAAGPVEFDVSIEGANFVQPAEVFLVGNGKVIARQEFPETSASLKWKGTLADSPTTDTWYVLVTRGTASLDPVVPGAHFDNKLVPVTPLAFTNPIWIDRDGDGKFVAINANKLSLMSEDRSAAALARLEELAAKSRQRPAANRKPVKPQVGE